MGCSIHCEAESLAHILGQIGHYANGRHNTHHYQVSGNDHTELLRICREEPTLITCDNGHPDGYHAAGLIQADEDGQTGPTISDFEAALARFR